VREQVNFNKDPAAPDLDDSDELGKVGTGFSTSRMLLR